MTVGSSGRPQREQKSSGLSIRRNQQESGARMLPRSHEIPLPSHLSSPPPPGARVSGWGWAAPWRITRRTSPCSSNAASIAASVVAFPAIPLTSAEHRNSIYR